MLDSFRVEFKRGCKPNIPRHLQIQLIFSVIFVIDIMLKYCREI